MRENPSLEPTETKPLAPPADRVAVGLLDHRYSPAPPYTPIGRGPSSRTLQTGFATLHLSIPSNPTRATGADSCHELPPDIVGGAPARPSGWTEAEGELLTLFVFFALGAVLLPAMVRRHALCALLSLTLVRMVPVVLSAARLGLDRATLAVLGWFGSRRLASVTGPGGLTSGTASPLRLPTR